MKKLLAIAICAFLLVASAACVKIDGELGEELNELIEDVKDEIPDEILDPVTDVLAGGWQAAPDFELTDEQRAIFEKGLENLVGADYVPVAYLGSQVVAGTNHCFLAETTVVYPGAASTYTLVFLYEDLGGNVTLMNVADMPVVLNGDGTAEAPGSEPLDGAWGYAESYEITDELLSTFNKALDGMVGANYIPVAQIGTQIVAGTNRCILAQVTPVVPDPVPHYAFVYIYEDLEGGAELLDMVDFDFGALCTYGG